MCKITSVNTNCDHLSTQKSLNMICKIDKSYVKWFGLVHLSTSWIFLAMYVHILNEVKYS